MINISEKISALRKAHNMTQEALGEAVGVSAQAVSKWEKGDSLPDISIIPDICRTFDISADALIGNDANVTLEMQIEKLLDKALDSGLGTNKRTKLANKIFTGQTANTAELKSLNFSIWEADCCSVADSRGFGLYFHNIEYIKNMMSVDLTNSELLKFMSDEKALKIFSLICINGMLNENEIIKLTGFSQPEVTERIFTFMKYAVIHPVSDESSHEIAYGAASKGVLLMGIMASVFLFEPESWKEMSSGEGYNHNPDRLRKFMN